MGVGGGDGRPGGEGVGETILPSGLLLELGLRAWEYFVFSHLYPLLVHDNIRILSFLQLLLIFIFICLFCSLFTKEKLDWLHGLTVE